MRFAPQTTLPAAPPRFAQAAPPSPRSRDGVSCMMRAKIEAAPGAVRFPHDVGWASPTRLGVALWERLLAAKEMQRDRS